MRRLKGSLALTAGAAAVTGVAIAALGGLAPQPAPSGAVPPSGLQNIQFQRMAALGDSITLGVNACAPAGACPESSWSTGNDAGAASFGARLAEATGHRPEAVNLAVGGAQANDLPGQAAEAAARGADLVTILVGGNDVCAPAVESMTSTPDYVASVQQALAALEAAPSQPVVFLASVPHVNGLLAAHAGNVAARQSWDSNKVCQSLLANPSSSAPADEIRRAAVAGRVQEYNLALAEQCAAVSRCIFDGGAVATLDFTPQQISGIDYFHPSQEGQRAIADATWTALADLITHCELPPALKGHLGC
jgi:lysophospholipase L1-like esterase